MFAWWILSYNRWVGDSEELHGNDCLLGITWTQYDIGSSVLDGTSVVILTWD